MCRISAFLSAMIFLPSISPRITAPPCRGAFLRDAQGGQSPWGPECRGTRVPGKKIKIIFDLPENADIALSPAQNLQVITIHNYLCCMGVLCTSVKLLTVLQISGCELHKYASGIWAPPGPTGGAIALSQPRGRYKGEEREVRGRTWLGIGRRGRRGKGRT